MEPYSPFSRSISELQTSDLAVLSEVHEGWHVEFKRDRVSPKSLAKAVSSFANTYGGWLFLGVEEQSSAPHTARSFPGIDNSEIDAAVKQVRQSLNQHLHPVPYFESTVLRGPDVDLGLTVDRSIVVIHVPRSHSSPHIHSDGRIYMRVADSSEPQHLTDRHLLDQLWERGDSIREETRRWIDRDPEFSEAEAEYPFLRLMFSPDLWHGKSRMHGLSLDQVQNSTCQRFFRSCASSARYNLSGSYRIRGASSRWQRSPDSTALRSTYMVICHQTSSFPLANMGEAGKS